MAELVNTYRGVVYPWHCDHMGHMNVMWYVGKFDEASWQFLTTVGITPTYLRDQGRGLAALHQDITYQRELRAGDGVTIHSRALEVNAKVVRIVHEMRNVETSEVAATMILTAIHMDTLTRKASPFPAEIVTRIRQTMESNA